jgi:hypothetical protein
MMGVPGYRDKKQNKQTNKQKPPDLHPQKKLTDNL